MNSAENLGEVLRGDRIENSVYTVSHHIVSMFASLSELNLVSCPELCGICSLGCDPMKHAKLHVGKRLQLGLQRISKKKLMKLTR